MAFVRAAQPRRKICDAIPVRDPLGADPAVVVSDDAGQLTVGGAVTAVIAGKPALTGGGGVRGLRCLSSEMGSNSHNSRELFRLFGY